MLASAPLDISISASPDKLLTEGTKTVFYAPDEDLEGINPLPYFGSESYVGPALLIDLPLDSIRSGDLIPIMEEILEAGEQFIPERLLLRTSYLSRGKSNYPCLEVDAIEYLFMAGVRLIGIDCPSIDKEGEQSNTQLMRVNRQVWLTNIDLSKLKQENLYLLFAAPCKETVGTVPCRAFVIPLT